MHIPIGGLKASIYIFVPHSNIIFVQDIFIPKVAEFSLFGGTLTMI